VRYDVGMPATKERSKPTTREAILERAVDVASEEGLEALTIGRLAAELQMSKSGLFGHFGSKKELQLATIEEASKRFIEAVVTPALEQEPGAPRLRALANGDLAYMEGEVFSGGCFWGSVTAEFDNRPGPVRDAIKRALAIWMSLLREQAELAGVDDPDQLAFELQSLAQGANASYQLFGNRRAFELARSSFDRLLP
jgi:AcrR family transcriptional regulator